ncbi:B9 domain-containing protein 1 [Cladochytrium tenue]|nr:B9 domain-containing protein 1 [Cladochytrium tenue]
MEGLEDGLTQIARTATHAAFGVAAYETGSGARPCVWNFPLDIAFRSTNPFGWPQIVLCIYGLDEFGRDVVRGYGCARMPLQHTLYVPAFVPVATSPLNALLSWIAGRPPEFLDSRFVARNSGREVTRVRSKGSVKLVLNVVTKGMDDFGLQTGPTPFVAPTA